MGLRPPSFELLGDGRLAQNAGLVTAFFSAKVVVTSAGREIPTRTEWTGRTSSARQATEYAMLRPASGDWPLGELHVVGLGWQDSVIAECALTVGPAIDGTPPACEFVSGPMTIHTMAGPDSDGAPPTPGIAYAGLVDRWGPLVRIVIEYTRRRHRDVNKVERIALSEHGSGAIVVGDHFDELKRILITNVIGKTLELLPPFPHGTPPDGLMAVAF